MIDLSNPTDRDKLEELITDDINQFCATYYESGHRNHLGASELGENVGVSSGMVLDGLRNKFIMVEWLRLFNVGHSAEPRFIAYLRGIGFEVKEFDENGKQFRISARMDITAVL